MRRSVLFSLLIIGAAISVVVGAGTFGAFSDEETIDGTVTSAIVDFELSGDSNTTGTTETSPSPDDILEIGFDNVGDSCGFLYFAPGDPACTIEISLTRANLAQQLAVDLTVTTFSVDGVANGAGADLDAGAQAIGLDCDGVAGPDWHVSWAWFDDAGDNDFMPAAGPDSGQRIDVTVSLDLDSENGCQNSVIDPITIVIRAQQDALNPHNTADTNTDNLP